MDFTKPKFLDLPLERQHKKCAECLRTLYEMLLTSRPVDNLLTFYNDVQMWMDSEKLEELDAKAISDRYHDHLRKAKVRHKEHNLLPRVKQGDNLKAKSEPWPIAVYLDNLRSAHNVGSIVRTVEALALGTVYFSPGTPYIDNKQVQDAAMGASEWVACVADASVDKLPRPIIVMETCEEAISLYEFLFPESFTLAIGNEEYGSSDCVLKQADCIIEIPMRGRKNSLNVANAFAIAAAEIQKQKSLFKGLQ